jgi:hypothetical protein
MSSLDNLLAFCHANWNHGVPQEIWLKYVLEVNPEKWNGWIPMISAHLSRGSQVTVFALAIRYAFIPQDEIFRLS